MAGGVEGVSVLGRWIAEGGDEEGATEHAWFGYAGRVWDRWGVRGRCGGFCLLGGLCHPSRLFTFPKRDRRPCIFGTFRAWVFLIGIEEVSPAYVRKILKNKGIPAYNPLNCFAASFYIRPL